MNEMEKKTFFPEIFEEKMRKCNGIEDVQQRRDCKITILEDAVKKIGAGQKPVQWWLEVIAEGTKPLFDGIKNEMDVGFNETATREDLERFKTDVTGAVHNNNKDLNEKFDELREELSRKRDDFHERLFNALGHNEKK